MRVGWGPAPHPGPCASGEPALSTPGDFVSSVGGDGGWGWRRCRAEVHRGCSQPGWSLQPWQGAGAAPYCCQELCLHFGVRTADPSPCIIACCLADTSAYLFLQLPHRRVTFSAASQAQDLQDPSQHSYYDSGLEESETPSSKSSSGPRIGPLALPEDHYERTTPDGSIGEMEHPENGRCWRHMALHPSWGPPSASTLRGSSQDRLAPCSLVGLGGWSRGKAESKGAARMRWGGERGEGEERKGGRQGLAAT